MTLYSAFVFGCGLKQNEVIKFVKAKCVINLASENTVFKRYNTAVVVTFIIIAFVALTAASLRYYSELTEHKKRGLNQLTAQAEQLNSMLVQSEQAISGIQEFAQYNLKYPNQLHAKLPPLQQDGKLFYLDKPIRNSFEEENFISGSITGFGDIESFSLLKQQEISMANALTPAFVTAQKVIEEANWFYYLSKEKFVNLFPFIDRDSWRFSDRMLTNDHVLAIQRLDVENNKVIWSSPYIDTAGTGLNLSLGLGVYRQKKMLGAIIIDISLARLHQSLPKLNSGEQSLVLINNHHEVLIFKQKGIEPLIYRASWQKLLPSGLHHLNQEALAQLPNSVQVGDWLVEKQTLPINGWTLIKYQPYSNFISPLRNHFIFMFTILLIGLFVFLMLVNAMTRRTFIQPTHDFISHIEYCAQGDPGKVKANADWLHWFVLVEDIFTQNRSLLLQLKEQNEELDCRVLEKTRALQESSTKHQRDYVLLRSVMNAIPELIIFNDPNGNLIGCNRAFERLSGLSENEMLGTPASTFMPKVLAHKIDCLNKGLVNTYPQQALIEAGEKIYQGFCNQFSNKQDDVLGTITILQDVTEQQATQSALEKAKNQAEYANQVKTQFLANMSHEIRTPINAIQGMMSLLTSTVLNSRQQHYLTHAQTSAFSLLHLIDELLDLSKIEAGKMTVVKDVIDLPSVIDTALKLNASTLYAKKLSMKVELSQNVPSLLMSDEMRLVQVFSNLLNNAIKFTEQGEITLSVDSVGASGTDTLIRFKVKDTGIGIAKDNQSHLFEAFSQADISMTRKYGGSGLGLSICQQIVNLLGGEITLKSDLGEGCEFTFILPFALPTSDVVEKSGIKVASNKMSTVKICVIAEELSASCIASVKALNWSYYQFSSLSQFNNTLLTVGSIDRRRYKEKVVVLMNEKTLSSVHSQLENLAGIDLIGLCQPATQELSSKSCQQLEKIMKPYLLLDTPLFRYSLEKIAECLLSGLKKEHNNTKLTIENEVVQRNDNPLAANKVEAKGSLSHVNILLVEDNLVNQMVAKELLLSMKAKVSIAENGQVALDTLEEHSFDVVLMDIQMPIMDGLTAAKEIRKKDKFQYLPIIAMTAHAREEDKLRSLAVGMNLHIAKPVTAEKLKDSILQVTENGIEF